MTNNPLKGRVERLFSLSPGQFRVVYWKYMGLTNNAVSEHLGIAVGTVETQVTDAYAKLGLAEIEDDLKIDELKRRFGEIIDNLDVSDVNWDRFGVAKWAEVKRDYLERFPLREEDTPTEEPIDVTGEWPGGESRPGEPPEERDEIFELPEIPPPPPPRIEPPWRWIIAAGILLAVGLFVSFLFFQPRTAPEPTQEDVDPIETTAPETGVTPTDTQPAPPAEPPPVVITSAPEAPSEPAITPLVLGDALFEDPFDGRLASGWTLVVGAPEFRNGGLTSQDELILQVGDSSWRDYMVSVAVAPHSSNAVVFVYLRMQDLANFLFFVFVNNELTWFIYDNYNNQEVPGTRIQLDGVAREIYVWVKDDFAYAGIEPGVPVTSFQIPWNYAAKYAQGGVGFSIKLGTVIDNFRINQLH